MYCFPTLTRSSGHSILVTRGRLFANRLWVYPFPFTKKNTVFNCGVLPCLLDDGNIVNFIVIYFLYIFICLIGRGNTQNNYLAAKKSRYSVTDRVLSCRHARPVARRRRRQRRRNLRCGIQIRGSTVIRQRRRDVVARQTNTRLPIYI